MPPRGFYRENSSLLSKLVLKISVKVEHLRRMFIKSTDCLYFNCCGFLFRFYHVYSIEHQEDETIWALQSLRMCMGIPGVIACSTFQVTFFCFFEEIFSAEMIPALPPVLCHFHQFCHILCGGGGGEGGGSLLSSSKHISKYSFSVQFFRLLLLRWSEVLYYPVLFPSKSQEE